MKRWDNLLLASPLANAKILKEKAEIIKTKVEIISDKFTEAENISKEADENPEVAINKAEEIQVVQQVVKEALEVVKTAAQEVKEGLEKAIKAINQAENEYKKAAQQKQTTSKDNIYEEYNWETIAQLFNVPDLEITDSSEKETDEEEDSYDSENIDELERIASDEENANWSILKDLFDLSEEINLKEMNKQLLVTN